MFYSHREMKDDLTQSVQGRGFVPMCHLELMVALYRQGRLRLDCVDG